MTARSAIRYAHNGDVSIAYKESGSGIDLLVIGGFVSHLETFPTLPAAQRFWDRFLEPVREDAVGVRSSQHRRRRSAFGDAE